MKVKKIDVLAKCTGHYPETLEKVIQDEQAITPNEALAAMEQYAEQFIEALQTIVNKSGNINSWALGQIAENALKHP